MISKEAWYREALAYIQSPDLNDLESLWQYSEELEGRHYHVGYMIEVGVEFHPEDRDLVTKWEEIRAGSLGQGKWGVGLLEEVEKFGQNHWYMVSRDPLTWQIDLVGQFAVLGEWRFFGLSNKVWEELVAKHGPHIRAEIQVQLMDSPPVEQQVSVTPDEAATAASIRSELTRVRQPPGFASFLSQEYRRLRSFLHNLNLEDAGQVQRMVEKEDALRDMAKDMDTANREAVNIHLFPVVSVPVGIYEYILNGVTPEARDPHQTEFHNYRED